MIAANKPNKTKHNGWTLIELLIALVIIGVVAGIATVAWSSWSSKHHSRFVRDRSAHSLRLLALKSLSDHETIRCQITTHQLQCAHFDASSTSGNRWLPLRDAIWRTLELAPPPLTLHLAHTNNKSTMPFAGDNIYFLPSGEIIPFTLVISNKKSIRYTIHGFTNGVIKLEEQQ